MKKVSVRATRHVYPTTLMTPTLVNVFQQTLKALCAKKVKFYFKQSKEVDTTNPGGGMVREPI